MKKYNYFEILVLFEGGRCVTYTSAILELLKTDKNVHYILNATTGEVLYNYENEK